MDKLLTETGYYDGPRSGLCTLQGEPHFYESTWEEFPYEDGETEVGVYHRFILAPADPESVELALEAWKSWKRWEAAFHTGRASAESHPALPEDRPRLLVVESRLNEIRAGVSWSTYCRLVEHKWHPPDGAVASAVWEKLPLPPAHVIEQFRATILKDDAKRFATYSRPRTSI